VVFAIAARARLGVVTGPAGQIHERLRRFAEAEVAAPAPHIRSQFRYRRLDADAFGSSRDGSDSGFEPFKSLRRIVRLTSRPAVKLNPRNARSCGRATALFASLTLSLAQRTKDGVLPHEIGVFVRSEAQLDRARAALKRAGLPFKILDEQVATTSGHVSISTMHLAKGLEFRAVAVMACDDEVIPLQERIETVSDDPDLKEVCETERHLLYVACHARKRSVTRHRRRTGF
jgi:hypothetical protein